MKVDLPSGHTAEFRDTLLRGDVREARKAIVIVTSPDGTRSQDGSFLDDITGRIIGRMLTDWSYDKGAFPLPAQCHTRELAEQALDRLDEADYAALEKAVGPWVQRVARIGEAAGFRHGPTGVMVALVNPADAAKLAAHPDFAREGGDDDPKNEPGSTGTSSPGSQELSGRKTAGSTRSTTS